MHTKYPPIGMSLYLITGIGYSLPGTLRELTVALLCKRRGIKEDLFVIELTFLRYQEVNVGFH